MKRSRDFFSAIASTLVVLGSVFATTAADASEDSKGAAADGPLLIAQLPPKPESKKYDLQYKLSRGEVLRYDLTHSASVSGTSEQTTQSAQSKTDSLKVWKVTDVLPEGDIEFVNLVERVHMTNQLPDHKATEYDSARDKIAPPGFEDTAKRVGVPLSLVRITPHGKVVSRQSKIRGQSADEDAPVVLRLPDLPVAIGETWDEPFEVKVNLQKGGSKSIQTRWHHKLTEVKNGIATIEVTYQVLSPMDAQIEFQLVQRMMSGEVQFDIAKGRVVSQQMSVDKRILGFAGPTSSAQYIMKMEERLLKDEPKTASKANSKTMASKSKPARTTKTASKPPTPQQNKSYRR